MIISDSTPLIYLAKIGKLPLLKEFFGEVLIAEEVKREVVDRGKDHGSPDAFVVENALNEGWIKVERAKRMEGLEEFGIHEGEAETISLAVHLNEKRVLVDQTHARLAAKALGIRPVGTVYVLLRALRRGFIDRRGYLKALEDLVRAGFRMSDEVYIEAVRLGEEIVERSKKERQTPQSRSA
jgi:predicted nucleic acid-binding protein